MGSGGEALPLAHDRRYPRGRTSDHHAHGAKYHHEHSDVIDDFHPVHGVQPMYQTVSPILRSTTELVLLVPDQGFKISHFSLC
jgi:hypothetical protein